MIGGSNTPPVEAQAFCEHIGMRLPSSREWEAIARGSANHQYGFEGELSKARLTTLNQQTRSGQVDFNHTSEGVWVTGLGDKADVIVVGQEYVVDGVTVEPTYREASK